MATRASKTLRVDLLGDAERLRRELRRAEEDLGKLGRGADDAGEDVRGLQSIIDRVDLGALAGAAGGLAIVETLDDAQVSAGRLAAQLGLTTDEAGEFTDVARRVYRDNFGDSMGEAAQVTGIVHQALSDLRGDALQGAVEDIFRISDAFEHVGADTQILTDGVRVLKAAWPDVAESEILDRIAGSFQAGTGNAGDLQDTLQEYPGLFADLGFTAGDLFAILDAGMAAGARNTDVVADAVKELGIRVQTTGDTGQVALRELFPDEEANRLIDAFNRGGEAGRDAFFDVAEALANTDDRQRQYTLAVELFGTKAEDLGPALIPMLEGFANARDRTDEVRDATGLLDQQYTGFRAQAEQVKRAIEVGIVGPLGGVVEVGGGVVGAAADVGIAMLGLKGAGVNLSGVFTRVRAAGASARGVIAGLAGSAGLGALGLALGAGAAALAFWAQKKAAATALAVAFRSAIEQDSGALGENTRALVANELEQRGLLRAAEDLGIELPTVVDAVIQGGSALDALGVEARNAARAHQDLTPEFILSARKVVDLDNGVQDLRGALEDELETSKRVGEATGDLGEQTDETRRDTERYTGSVEELTEAAEDSENQLDQVTQALEDLSGVTITARRAEIAWKQALHDATAASKENRRTLDTNTQAGRRNQEQLLDLVDSGQDVIRSQAEQGVSNDRLRRTVNEVRQGFIAQAQKMGATRVEARQLADQYGLIPKKVTTNVKATNLDYVTRTLGTYIERLNALPSDVRVKFQVGDGYGVPPNPGALSGGYQAQWAAVQQAGFGVSLASGFRPGAVTSTGNQSYHALGRAVDLAGSATEMARVFEWIRAMYGPQTRELIYTPKGGRQLKNGADHIFSGGTIRQDHYDHVHWALQHGGHFKRPWAGQIVAAERHPEVMAPEPVLRQIVREESGRHDGPLVVNVAVTLDGTVVRHVARVEAERTMDGRGRDVVAVARQGL